jgi:hypothetical protein
MVEGFDVASGAWSVLFREVEDARWEVEEVNGVHNRLELQTRFTPITSARALVYMGKSSTGKERATHVDREHLHQPFLCGRPQSYVSGPNRERSLRLCQGCLAW